MQTYTVLMTSEGVATANIVSISTHFAKIFKVDVGKVRAALNKGEPITLGTSLNLESAEKVVLVLSKIGLGARVEPPLTAASEFDNIQPSVAAPNVIQNETPVHAYRAFNESHSMLAPELEGQVVEETDDNDDASKLAALREASRQDAINQAAKVQRANRETQTTIHPEGTSSGNPFVAAWQQWKNFSGRANRLGFFLGYLSLMGPITVLGIVSSILGIQPSSFETFIEIYALFIVIPIISLEVRRLHDLGLTAWWALLYLVPIVNFFFILYSFLGSGTDGQNDYGPPNG